MGIGQTFPWRNSFISGFLGLLGISLVLFGIQQASKAATDEFGRVLIIGGLLLSYGAWRFWPVATPERTHHTTDHEPSPTSAERFPTALAGMSTIMNPPPPLQRGFRQRLLECQPS